MGADVLLSHLYRLRPDVLVTLGDVWWMTFVADRAVQHALALTGTRWLMYFPIDGHRASGELPPSWVEILRRADLPVAMSRYGQEVTACCGVPCGYVPHGVATDVFFPPEDRDAAKARIGYAGRFVILCDARNQPRKLLPRLLTAFERFARGRRDTLLHLHTDPRDPASKEARYSYNIAADVESLGLSDQVSFTNGHTMKAGIPLEDLVALYQAADVHVLLSAGEGFGLPTLQAAACGTIPLAPDDTASRELVRGHGVAIPIAARIPDEFGILRGFADVDATVGALESLHADAEQRRVLSAAAVEFAAPYDWSRVIPAWDHALHEAVAQPREAVRHEQQVLAVRSETVAPSWNGHGKSTSGDLGEGLLQMFGVMPGGAQVTMTVVSQPVGAAARGVREDARAEPGLGPLSIPLCRVAEPVVSQKAVPGAVWVTSTSSAQLVTRLQEVFPVLHSVGVGADPAASPDILASAVLALDLDQTSDDLPLWAACFGVPIVGLECNRWQRRLWPGLSISGPGAARAARLARDVLCDFPLTAAAVRQARQILTKVAPSGFAEAALQLAARAGAGSSRAPALAVMQ